MLREQAVNKINDKIKNSMYVEKKFKIDNQNRTLTIKEEKL